MIRGCASQGCALMSRLTLVFANFFALLDVISERGTLPGLRSIRESESRYLYINPPLTRIVTENVFFCVSGMYIWMLVHV